MPVETLIVCVTFEPGWQSRSIETSISVSLVFLWMVAVLDIFVAVRPNGKIQCGELMIKA